MGRDRDLVCKDCKESLMNVMRNYHLNDSTSDLDLLESFLNKHSDHHLIMEADDDWARVPGAKLIPVDKQEEDDLLQHLGYHRREKRNTKCGL